MDAKTLSLLLATLNSITVNGKENLGKLLVCINTVETELKKAQEAEKGE